MSRRPPDRKTIVIYLLVGLLLVALASVLFGGAGWFRLVRLLLVYGVGFLLILYVFRTVRRR